MWPSIPKEHSVKKSRYTEEQISNAMKQAETGTPVAEVFRQVAPNVTATARGAVSRRRFDDFYEDVTFVARKDWSYAVKAAVTWQVARGTVVGASAGYERQDSTFFLATYGSYEGALLASLTMEF
jgi:hypothetical protein